MKIAIMYQSLTGNTEAAAFAIRDALDEQVIYCGTPKQDVDADLYFVGSWTDKGSCADEIAALLRTMQGKRIAYFGTAGFGGSDAYYQALFARIKSVIPSSNQIAGSFFCQGKMPMQVRARYAAVLAEHPEDERCKASIENFDRALSHPDEADLAAVQAWAKSVCAEE